jgi:5-methylcytosine-specific restriction endonuclease McrA
MHSKAMGKVVEVILKYSASEQDAKEIISALSEVDWKSMFTGVVTCEACGYFYDICKKPSTWICPRCDPNKQREREKLQYILSREPKTETTLTLEVWIRILDRFDWKCAYCLDRQYVQLDHFMPLFLKGLTTFNNCVPSCRTCNLRKHNNAPDQVKLLPREDMERVHEFLKNLQIGA